MKDWSLSRVIIPATAGALIGALVTVSVAAMPLMANQPLSPVGLILLAFIFAFAFGAWALGLMVFALPFWWLFHKIGWRSVWHAVALGTVLAFIVYLVLTTSFFGASFPSGSSDRSGPTTSYFGYSDDGGVIIEDGRRTAYGWHRAVQRSVWVGALGGGVAVSIWLLAYRRGRITPPPAPPV